MRARTNSEWVQELSASGEEQAAALGDLRAYLLRAARYALHRSRGRLAHASAFDLDQLAEDCAQNALVAILEHLKEFRGDSRFTTWAYKFAINMALAAARREAWKPVSLDALLEQAGGRAWFPEAEALPGDPEQTARLAEAWAVIREVIDHDLSERQRQALKAVVADEVPLDELVRHWGSTRNAIYKLLHDARRKLKARLEARGFAPREVLGLFSGPR
ncbi:MAG: sigma-70 family RNA polymerase sigma factor [Candidatus Rokubacteria bacterium]|nr:sigma-70 family RNA polymerase sigma factor [Candidatus Rokubacteria bacterium]